MKKLLNPFGWLRRLTVSQQLFGAFASILVLTAALGATALVGLKSVDGEAFALSQKWLKGVGALSDARALAVEYRELEIKHSRTEDTSYHAEYEDKMKEAGKSLQALFAGYQGRVAGEEETALNATLSWRICPSLLKHQPR